MSNPGRSVVIGAGGQLGRALAARLPAAVALDLSDLDITDAGSVDRFDWSGVDIVYNAAAYTAVDRAQDDHAAAWATNAVGPAHLARAAALHGFTLVHTSTEYVFDGRTRGPIPETAPLSPLGVYAASKAAGQLAVAAAPAHLIVRTSWLVGDGHNFVRTMLSLADRGIRPSVVNDQVGRPTFAVAWPASSESSPTTQGTTPHRASTTSPGTVSRPAGRDSRNGSSSTVGTPPTRSPK